MEQLSSLFTTVDLMDATVAELLEAMEQGRLTSERLVQMYLDRIEAYDKPLGLNSIISINPKAMEEAKEADQKRADGETLGRLHGIPVIVKDNLDVKGMATTCGDIYRSNAIAYQDSEVVARLKQEGAIILAKANMAKYACSGANSRSSIGGRVHNAYDLSRTPAGSSGGTAVAITCNFATVGLGTDTGSSIRRPASFANIIGLRPSYGTVSVYGEFYLDWYKDAIGPMCRSAEDTALVLDVISGTDSKDRRTANADSYLPEGGYVSCLKEDGLSGKRIGYLANSFDYRYSKYSGKELESPVVLDSKILPMVEKALALLQEGGAELVDISQLLTQQQISYLSRSDDQSTMAQFRSYMNEFFEENNIDAVLYISQTDVAVLEKDANGNTNNHPALYINAFGPMAGLPEIMLPMGLSETDMETGYDKPLPLGMSLFAAYGNDEALLEIAYAYEQLRVTREQPQATPPLPDKSLEFFGQELLQDAHNLDREDFSEESYIVLSAAIEMLEKITMEQDPALYQARVEKLVRAYDALELASIVESTAAPTEAEVPTGVPTEAPTQPLPSQPEEVPEEEASAVAVSPWLWVVAALGLSLAAGIELWLQAQKRKQKRRRRHPVTISKE